MTTAATLRRLARLAVESTSPSPAKIGSGRRRLDEAVESVTSSGTGSGLTFVVEHVSLGGDEKTTEIEAVNEADARTKFARTAPALGFGTHRVTGVSRVNEKRAPRMRKTKVEVSNRGGVTSLTVGDSSFDFGSAEMSIIKSLKSHEKVITTPNKDKVGVKRVGDHIEFRHKSAWVGAQKVKITDLVVDGEEMAWKNANEDVKTAGKVNEARGSSRGDIDGINSKHAFGKNFVSFAANEFDEDVHELVIKKKMKPADVAKSLGISANRVEYEGLSMGDHSYAINEEQRKARMSYGAKETRRLAEAANRDVERIDVEESIDEGNDKVLDSMNEIVYAYENRVHAFVGQLKKGGYDKKLISAAEASHDSTNDFRQELFRVR